MSFELSGKLIEKFDTQQVTDSFRKREFVVEKEDMAGANVFTETIKFQTTQDRCGMLDEVSVNDQIKVNFNIRGRRWEKDGRVNYFNNLEAWKISKVGETGSPQNEAPMPQDIPADTEVNDDLPF